MAVPKRKTSKSRRDQRSASKFLKPKAFATCSHCSLAVMPHTICEACGYYKGKKIIKTKLDRALKRGEKKQAAKKAAPVDEQQVAPQAEETKKKE
jgi:large subunit ribosomal protein L32